MNKFLNELLNSNRLKSFLWRGGAIMLVAGLNFVSSNIGEFNLSQQMVVFIGLVIGEITKALNNVAQNKK
jgi:hypothetical protein